MSLSLLQIVDILKALNVKDILKHSQQQLDNVNTAWWGNCDKLGPSIYQVTSPTILGTELLLVLLFKVCSTVYQVYLNINQLDALNFIMSLFHASTFRAHVLETCRGMK